MPKKKTDPVLLCLTYFRDAPLEAAKTALIIAKETVGWRMAEAGEKPVVKRRKKLATADSERTVS